MGSRYYSKRLQTKRPKPGHKAPEKPKSFKTEESAHAWAKKNKVKKYSVVAIADGSKFKVRTRF
jgi:hypothetical protein